MKISGTIVDFNNEPMSGANITLISGLGAGKVGTISNFDGNFELDRSDFDENSLFSISYIGFVSQQYKASELQNKKIVLQESIDALDEVVLVGIKPSPKQDVQPIVRRHFQKNKYLYASLAGIAGILLMAVSIKKL
jgi:hypothetical protein